MKAPERIWAWAEDCGDVCVNEWVTDDLDCLGSYAEGSHLYILATPAALAATPEVAALIREAEAMVVERAVENKEQLDIWAQEILEGLSLADVLKIASYEDKIEAHDMVGRGLVEVIRSLADPSGVEALAALRADVDRLTRWRAEEGEKIKRQRKALTDLTQHCRRVEAERDGLARKVAAVQRSGDELSHSELADLQARVHNQRQEIGRVTAERDDLRARLAAAEKRSKENWTRVRRLWDLAKGWDPDDDEEGPFCRDCADEDGRCPHSGFPCDPQEEAEERISKTRARLAAAEAQP